MATTVYSTPNCVQCRATYRKLDGLNAKYDSVILAAGSDEEAAVHAILASDPSFGRIAPMVIHEAEGVTTIWTGYQPAKIEELCAAGLA